VLISTCVFALAWMVAVARLHRAQGTTEAVAPS
jgi:hypothetical protein